ncbi:MAG TPA: T9SS type A sorting domain-containing protein, partial [Bacteroidales bacterium]|nr:T9SS type A sorting domain-containing protein [Bacteroidales bacterium]
RESNEGQGISYYPNPFTSEVVVDMQHLDFDRAVLRIYDLLGKIMYERDLESSDLVDQKLTLDLNFLPAGIYSSEFVTEGYSNTSKIVKNY